ARSGSSFSRLFADASAATTTKRMRPARTACLTCAVPGTTAPARVARPRSRIAASGSRILLVRLPLCPSPAPGAEVRPPEDLRRHLPGLGELRFTRAHTFTRLRPRLLDGELLDQAQHLVRILGREARDPEEVFPLQVNDIQERSIPRALQRRQSGERQIELTQREVRDLVLRFAAAEQRLLRTALEPLAAAIQIDLPAQQLTRQPHVLPVAPDRQRELVLVHDRRDHTARRVTDHLRDLRGRQRAPGEDLRVRVPGHDVDPLAAQLAHHRLDARALQPHAGADGVNGLVPRVHRHLRPSTDLARDPLDVHDTLVDLRDLQLEQRRHEHGIRTRQDQPRPLGRLLDPLQHRTDRLALTEPLPRVLLLPRDDRFRLPGLVEHHHDLATLDLLDFSAQQLADPVRVLLADALALALADSLDDPLLGGHHRV